MSTPVDRRAVAEARLRHALTVVSDHGTLSVNELIESAAAIGPVSVLEYCVFRGLPTEDCFTLRFGQIATSYVRVVQNKTLAHHGMSISTRTGAWVACNVYSPRDLVLVERYIQRDHRSIPRCREDLNTPATCPCRAVVFTR